jgi:seryl-tRNA synthetase
VVLITEARSRLDRALAARVRGTAAPRAARAERIGELKRKHEAELARIASQQLSELVGAMSEFEEHGAMLSGEIQRLRTELASLRATSQSQAASIEQLTSLLVRLEAECVPAGRLTTASQLKRSAARPRRRDR